MTLERVRIVEDRMGRTTDVQLRPDARDLLDAASRRRRSDPHRDHAATSQPRLGGRHGGGTCGAPDSAGGSKLTVSCRRHAHSRVPVATACTRLTGRGGCFDRLYFRKRRGGKDNHLRLAGGCVRRARPACARRRHGPAVEPDVRAGIQPVLAHATPSPTRSSSRTSRSMS